MALKGRTVKSVTIFTDNQASILSSARPRHQSGQFMLRKIHHLVAILERKQCKVTIRWIPAHVGVPGNEAADILAKQATGWRDRKSTEPVDTSGIQKMSWMPQLLSSCKRLINQNARRLWGRMWSNGETGMQYKKRWQDKDMNLDRHINKLYLNLHKAESSVLIQMRTEKIGLYGYLSRIKRADDPWCGCRQAYQSVRHIIEECECLMDIRKDYLGSEVVQDARIFLRDPKLIHRTVSFMLATGLLDQFASYTKTISPLL